MKKRLGKQLCRSVMKTCHGCALGWAVDTLPTSTADIFHQHNLEARMAAKMRRAAEFVVLNRNYAYNEFASYRHVMQGPNRIQSVVTWSIEDVHTFGTADYIRAIY